MVWNTVVSFTFREFRGVCRRSPVSDWESQIWDRHGYYQIAHCRMYEYVWVQTWSAVPHTYRSLVGWSQKCLTCFEYVTGVWQTQNTFSTFSVYRIVINREERFRKSWWSQGIQEISRHLLNPLVKRCVYKTARLDCFLGQFDPLFLGSFAELRKAIISFIMSVRLSTWNNLAPTRRTFMKWEIWALFANLSRKFKFQPYLNRITGTLREDQCTFFYISLGSS
jgi:hypothetical protein